MCRANITVNKRLNCFDKVIQKNIFEKRNILNKFIWGLQVACESFS